MTLSFKGFGTRLIKASKLRHRGEHDAIEALSACYLPVIPYKAMHVLYDKPVSISAFEYNNFHAIPLRFASRIIAKAFLRTWSIGLFIFTAIFFFLDFTHKANSNDYLIQPKVYLFLVATGIMFKIILFFLNKHDEKIRNFIGRHELGSSDPYYWHDSIFKEVIAELIKSTDKKSFYDIAHDYFINGNNSKAMYFIRISMRLERNKMAKKLFNEIMKLGSS